MSHRPRVIIVGGGMVGARCAEELRAKADAEALEIVILADEKYPPYNRVLLSALLAGGLHPRDTELRPTEWWESEDIEIRTSTTVETVEPNSFLIHATGPEGPLTLNFDHLVFATGARSFVPPALLPKEAGEVVKNEHGPRGNPGVLQEDGHPLIVGFRGLQDCDKILAAAKSETCDRIAVIGGGVLGIEIADSLAQNPDFVSRGGTVALLHPGDTPMDKQLGTTAGAILASSVREQGVELHLAARIEGTVPGGLLLHDGAVVPAEIVVVAAGVRAETSLAEDSGVEVDRGIRVDSECATSMPGLWAVGDCSELEGRPTGTLRPGWAQAEVVSHNIIVDLNIEERDSRHTTSCGRVPAERRSVRPGVDTVRLSIETLDVASFGRWRIEPQDWEPGGPDITVISDPAAGRYGKLVVESGRIVGGVLVGMDDVVGTVTQMFDTGAPAPLDRLAMLTGTEGSDDATTSNDPAKLPDEHIVCVCNSVSKEDLQDAHNEGACDVASVAECTRATTGCGTCVSRVESVLEWLSEKGPVMPSPKKTPT